MHTTPLEDKFGNYGNDADVTMKIVRNKSKDMIAEKRDDV